MCTGRSAFKDGIESKDPPLINNRQAGRRNRGRNNGRQNGGNRGGDSGNRIDNRARGNAPQLLEKYKNMARDAQLAGDRVNAEFYLQFADHYFRVVADNRSRLEEQQARHRRNEDSFDDEGDQGGLAGDAGSGASDDADCDESRDYRRVNGNARPTRSDTERGAADAAEQADMSANNGDVSAEREEPPRRAPRNRKPRKPREEATADQNDTPGFDLAALPPAINRADNDSGGNGDGATTPETPAPKRRGRPRRAAPEAAE